VADKSRLSASKPPLWTFFAASFGWSWLFWLIAIALKLDVNSGGGTILMLAGLLGPMVAGITFTYLTYGREGRRDYWARLAGFGRIGLPWYLIIFLLVPFLNVIAALIDVLLGGTGATWGEAALNFLSDPLTIVMLFVFAALAPFIEELGWRGYALDRLQAKRNALVSSLILGVIWSLWHLPLFFVAGTYQQGLGVGTWDFWLFMVGIVPLTVVITWIYNHTRRATLAAILFHAMVNFTGEIIAVTPRADTILIGLWFVAAVVVTLIWGPKTLTGRDGSPHAGPELPRATSAPGR
jgi:membrane protease YdiL (CAAX protease family)